LCKERRNHGNLVQNACKDMRYLTNQLVREQGIPTTDHKHKKDKKKRPEAR